MGGSVARQERAVDPTTGPLQSFAYELRKVRIEAGSPTYRALAKVAGYSATTLSEAAGGLRKPSLDVVLAYVGACGGDVEAWRLWWQELDLRLAGTDENQSAMESPRGAPPDNGASVVKWSLVDALTRRWRRALPVALAVALTTTVALVVIVLLPDDRFAASNSAGGCPAMPSHRTFTAVTYGKGASVRAGATVGDPVLSTIPSGCTVGFTGFCLGQKVWDVTGGAPDIRWFILENGNVLPSALVHGIPPAALEPMRCEHDRPAPDAIALVVTADAAGPGNLRAEASGRNLDIVGFAVRHTTGDWLQLGLTEGSAFDVILPLDQSAGPAPRGRIVIAAAACLGGDGPTSIIDAKAVPVDKPTADIEQPTLSPQEYATAGRIACQYPRRK
jgi:hypothetical protein